MAKRVQLMTNAKEWQTVDGVEVLVDVPQEDLDPITDSSCVEIEGHRTLEETISQDNMFTPEIVETKVYSKVGGVYHDNVVDGAYEEAILYGNTQVNLVESMTSGTKYIPHSFTSFQGNESKIGNYRSGRTNQVAPLVKGVTMVNLAQKTSVTIPEGNNGGAIKNVKPNTKYTLFLDFTVQNTQKGFSIHSFKDATTYLETATVRTGMGEKVKFTFTTHEEANTIYIVNNTGFGGEIQLDNIMVIEGDVTDLDLPFFKGMRSVELSKPLTNLFTDDLQVYSTNSTATNSGGNVTVTSTTVSSWNASQYYLKGLKQNTKYIAMWDSLTTTQTATTQQEILVCVVSVQDNVKLGGINEDEKCPTLRSIIFDTRDKPLNEIVIRIHASMSNSEATTTTVTGLRVFEWDDSLRTLDLQGIGYFSGTKYVSARALETEGKNLYPYGDVNFTNDYVGWCDAKGKTGMYGDIAQKSSTRFLLKKGTYTFSIGSTTNVELTYIVDDKEQQVGHLGPELKTFTLAQDTYCTLRVKTVEANVVTTVTNIQIERGETATSYEAYHSRYYKPRETEEIILRSLPNGVCDTFNLQTGELVQNIGVAIYDGSDDELWGSDGVDSNNIPYFTITKSLPAIYTTHKLMYNCDIYKPCLDIDTDKIGITTTHYGLMLTANNYIRIKNGTTTREEFMASLKEKPVTLIYALKEPIITKLQTYDRVYNGQTNALVNMGNNLSALSYIASNFYLKVANLSPVPAILEPITAIPYDVRLKPSTLYTIKYSRGGASNSMKFDLGGSVVEKTNSITSTTGIAEELTVKTPAILSHEQLILSGTGYAHNFIIVEGDITGTELPYFEGMKDVKMPIVKNIGKNLFDGELYIDMGINANGTTAYGLPQGMSNSPDWVTTKNLIPITKGKKISITIDADDEDITTNRRYVYIYKYDMHGNFIVNDRYDLGLNTKTYTMNHYGYIKCTIRTHNVKNITITETDTPQPCIDYRVNSVYAVQGEYPITSEMIEQGGFSMSGFGDGSYEKSKYDNTARLRSKDLIPVKPNTTYAFTHSFSKFAYNIYQWNGNKEFIDGVSQYFNSGQIKTITTTADTQYIHFLMSKDDASQAITVAEYDWSQFHMYELDSTINLRSLPNGVKDELNLLTGEYIQRVGEVVLDGSQTLQSERPTYPRYYIELFDMKKEQVYTNSMKCDKLNVASNDADLTETEKTLITGYLDSYNRYPDKNWLYFNVANIAEKDAMISYLQSNPITVQYELAEPIISYPRIVSNNQEREVGVKLPNGVSNTYNPSTGITTVRVGKIVLDGSENWILFEDATITSGLKYFRMPNPSMKPYNIQSYCNWVLSDSLPTVPYDDIYIHGTSKKAAISGVQSFGLGGIGALYIYYSEITTVEQLKTWLSQNPVTVWYELKYPQIQPDIVLPNGVHDEYNPETGVYTKRIGTMVLDGSADEAWHSTINDQNKTKNTAVFFTLATKASAKKYDTKNVGYPIYCKEYAYNEIDLGSTAGSNLDIEGAYMAFDGNACFSIKIEKLLPYGLQTELSSTYYVEIIRKYLADHPWQVWYELATPITYQLTPYFGLPQPYAYEDGYLIHDSAYTEATLPPEFKYKLVANRTGQIVQNGRKLQEHTTRLSNLEALIIEATIESLFNRELQLFELELMDIQLIDLGE